MVAVILDEQRLVKEANEAFDKWLKHSRKTPAPLTPGTMVYRSIKGTFVEAYLIAKGVDVNAEFQAKYLI